MTDRKVITGGACFSPSLDPRPQYPGYDTIFKEFLLSTFRQPVLLAIITKLSFPVFLNTVSGLKSRGWDDSKLFMLFAMVVHSGSYFTINGFFLACDKFKWFQQYKLFRKPIQEPSDNLLLKCIKDAVIAQFILGPIIAYNGFNIFQMFGMLGHDAPLVSFPQLVKQFAIAKFLNGFLFYWAHRFSHHKNVYKHVHKQHHEFVGTVGMAAEYAGPIEQVIANQAPTLIGCLLFARNPIVLYVWLLARTQETYEAHSGYCLANTFLHKIGLTNATHTAFHDYHHTVNRGNFGEFYLDALFGTMDGYIDGGGFNGYVKKGKTV